MFGKLFDKLFGKKTESQPIEEEDEDFLEEEEDEEEDYLEEEEEYDEDEDEDYEDEEEEPETEEVPGFHKTFGDVTIRSVKARKVGICLEAVNGNGESILMEHYENDRVDLPDGSNAYFFGNKLIIVTRWYGMSAQERRKVETAELALAFHPYPCVQVSLKVADNWGDVMVNLYHCYTELNDENAPVDQAILIFADTEDADYITCRTVALPGFVQKFLQRCNVNSHKVLRCDLFVPSMRGHGRRDPRKTFSDMLYDMCWEMTADFYHKARMTDLENIPDGVYLEIGGSNKVTKVYQND